MKKWFHWLIDWLVDGSIDWSIDWLIDCLIDWLIDCVQSRTEKTFFFPDILLDDDEKHQGYALALDELDREQDRVADQQDLLLRVETIHTVISVMAASDLFRVYFHAVFRILKLCTRTLPWVWAHTSQFLSQIPGHRACGRSNGRILDTYRSKATKNLFSSRMKKKKNSFGVKKKISVEMCFDYPASHSVFQAQGKQVRTIEGNITEADIATTVGAHELALVRKNKKPFLLFFSI